MTRWRRRLAIVAILVLGGVLRWHGLDWDQGHHLHPDERFLTMVETSIDLPSSVAEYFDTAASPLNPANRGHDYFTYGTVPLFLVRALGEWTGWSGYHQVHLLGRALSGLFDLGTIGLVYRLGFLLGGGPTGLVAAGLTAFSVFSIQQAHFFTVDTFGTFFATAGLLSVAHLIVGGGLAWHVAFGIALGFATACRINLALVAGAYGIALAVLLWRREWRRLVVGPALAGVVALVLFRILQPYAFVGPGFFDVSFAEAFLSSLRKVYAFSTGAADFPPNVQWIGRPPLFFPLKNLLLWNIGPGWGLLALAGLGLVWTAPAGTLPRVEDRTAARALVLWGIAYFVYHGSQFVMTGRYFLPLVPVLALVGAVAVRETWRRSLPVRTVALLLLGITVLWAMAFTAIYRAPHSRVVASEWIHRHVPSGATIAVEHWDDALPLPGQGRRAYERIELRLYDEATEAKRAHLVESLDRADWIVISSERLYRSIPRAPWRYPLARRYYELLFSGELGFELVRVVTSYPRLGPFEIPDDGAEEAFTVYDHPKVLIFRKTDRYSHERVEQLLQAVRLDRTVHAPPAEASALYREYRPEPVTIRGEVAKRQPVPGETDSLGAALLWLLALEAVALSFLAVLFPIARSGELPWGLSRCLAWVGIPWTGWILAASGIAPRGPGTARALVGGLVILAGTLAWRRRRRLAAFLSAQRRNFLAVEVVFLGSFLVFALLRSWNPAIHWGEKPMDFAILNAILRSPWLPPADPWFAGETLNYPYFGHAVVAFFTDLTGLPPAFTFNLALATIGAVLATAAFLFGHHLGRGIVPGLLAAFGTVFLGNLAGPRLLVEDPSRAIDFHYFWATSRVVEGTINEYPFWNILFGDLHAHVMSQPIEMLVIVVGAIWIGEVLLRKRLAIVAGALLLAWCVGAVAVTSSWSAPVAAALAAGFVLTGWRQAGGRMRSLPAASAVAAGIIAASVVPFLPHWFAYEPPPRHWGFESGTAPVGDVVTIFGVFLLIGLLPLGARIVRMLRGSGVAGVTAVAGAGAVVAAVVFLRSPACGLFAFVGIVGAAAWWDRDQDQALRKCSMMITLAGAIGVSTETFWIWDRMNTVFKYYLAMWLLLAPASVVLAWRAEPKALRQTGMALLVVAFAAGSFTSITAATGYLRFPMAPSDVPTLDGTNYLERRSPDVHEAWQWLNREIDGVPVVLEAHGPSYREFSRASMNTGLPTVLGWEYHLMQQARSRREIARRKEDVRTLYETTDLETAERLFREYRIDLVVVGPVERRTYDARGLEKFDRWDRVQPVFRNRRVTIYGTPGIPAATKTWIEPVARSRRSKARAPLETMREPRGVARRPDGSLYVADFGYGRILRFDPGGEAKGVYGNEGERPGEFRDPCGVAVGPEGRLHVADTWNHRVQVLEPTGEVRSELHADFYGPRGIAVDETGRIYVTDTGHHRVVVLAPDGRVLEVWKGEDLPAGFGHPVGISARGDEVMVADTDGRRIVVFGSDGAVRRLWSVPGWDGTGDPYLDVGPDGAVWVTDPPGDRVWIFSGDGRQLREIETPDLSRPTGVAVIDEDRAVVVSSGRNRLVFVDRRLTSPSNRD